MTSLSLHPPALQLAAILTLTALFLLHNHLTDRAKQRDLAVLAIRPRRQEAEQGGELEPPGQPIAADRDRRACRAEAMRGGHGPEDTLLVPRLHAHRWPGAPRPQPRAALRSRSASRRPIAEPSAPPPSANGRTNSSIAAPGLGR